MGDKESSYHRVLGKALVLQRGHVLHVQVLVRSLHVLFIVLHLNEGFQCVTNASADTKILTWMEVDLVQAFETLSLHFLKSVLKTESSLEGTLNVVYSLECFQFIDV